jgi:hypothetical protein
VLSSEFGVPRHFRSRPTTIHPVDWGGPQDVAWVIAFGYLEAGMNGSRMEASGNCLREGRWVVHRNGELSADSVIAAMTGTHDIQTNKGSF